MLHPLLSPSSSEYAKYAAWLTIILTAIAALPYLKRVVVSFLLSLYEEIIRST